MTRKASEDLQDPDYQGSWGRAWEVTGAAKAEMSMAQPAGLGAWLIEAPMVNPLWSYYVAGLVHLEDLPGVPPVKFSREGASHEFVIGTVNPEVDNTIDPSDFGTFRLLFPPDLIVQLIFPSGERALEVVRLAVQHCVDGELSPDARGHRQCWADFFRSHEQ